MAKRKAKKAKVVNPLVQENIERITKLIESFKADAGNYERYLDRICVDRCYQIEKLYMDSLKKIPENFKNMRIAEVMELQQREKIRETECPRNENAFRMQHERAKLTSERKLTQRKEKKRSISAPASARNLSMSRHNVKSHLNRTGSELSLITPAKQRKPSMIVTPKFNPQLPALAARKPKPGEVVMSLSGSPLQNLVDDLSIDKPDKITLSLGQGRVITFGDTVEIDSQKEFLNSIDEPLKNTIYKVQQQLNQILKKN